MKCLNDRFIIEPAKASDGRQMLELLEQTPYEGNVSLLYTRRPNAYESFLAEGKETEVSVCKDTKNNKIVGMGAFVIQDLYIDGKVEKAAYIFGLKGNQDYLKRYPLLHKFYEYLDLKLKNRGIAICYTTILKGNVSAQKLLEKKRAIMPFYVNIGNFKTFAIKNKSKISLHDDYIFSKAKKEDIPQVVEFINTEGSRFQLYPVVNCEDVLNESCKGINSESFYIVKKGVEVVAAGALWDQRDYKQYIVKKYSGLLKVFKTFPFLCRMFQMPSLPNPGEMLNFYTLSRWAIKNNDVTIFNIFLDNLMNKTQDYPFLVVGIHESHPLKDQLMRRKHVKYESIVYLVDWNKQKRSLYNCEMPSYIECGAL